MRHDATFKGFYAALALITAAGLFFFVLHIGGRAYRHHTETQPSLSDWSLARILAELGEYDQKIPNCAGLVDGMTGYAYAKVSSLTGQLKGVILVCK